MCGTIKDDQFTQTVTIRLTTSADNAKVQFMEQFKNVEEIWIDEYSFRNTVIGSHYFRFNKFGISPFPENNENQPGVLLYNNNGASSHEIYQRPRILARSEGTGVQQLEITIRDAATQAITLFDEFVIVLTFVMHKPALIKASSRYGAINEPQVPIKGVDPKTTFHGGTDFMSNGNKMALPFNK